LLFCPIVFHVFHVFHGAKHIPFCSFPRLYSTTFTISTFFHVIPRLYLSRFPRFSRYSTSLPFTERSHPFSSVNLLICAKLYSALLLNKLVAGISDESAFGIWIHGAERLEIVFGALSVLHLIRLDITVISYNKVNFLT
jgi:hypothetical protein